MAITQITDLEHASGARICGENRRGHLTFKVITVIIQLSLEAPFATESFAFSQDVIFCCDNLRGHKPSRPGLLTRIHLHIKKLIGLVLQASSRMPALNGSWASARGHQRWHCWICRTSAAFTSVPCSRPCLPRCSTHQMGIRSCSRFRVQGELRTCLPDKIGFRGLSVSMAQVAPVVHVAMLRPLVEGPLHVAAAGAVSSCQYLPKEIS